MEPSRWRYWQGDGTFIARRGKAVYKRNEEKIKNIANPDDDVFSLRMFSH